MKKQKILFFFFFLFLFGCAQTPEKELPPKFYARTVPEAFSVFDKKEVKIDRIIGVLGTGSMKPYIRGGKENEIVAYAGLQNFSYEKLERGDLVVYNNRHGKRTLHKLIGLVSGGWIAKGLANEALDEEKVTPENFVGKVVLVVQID